MAQPAKKRKLNVDLDKEKRKLDVKKYAENVQLGKVEGTFDENDLLANCEDEYILRKKREKDFKILPLLFNGKPTGWGKCLPCSRPIFRISDHETGIKYAHIKRHLRSWHSTESERKELEREKAKSKSSGQMEIGSFLSKRRLTPSQQEEMRRLNLEVMTTTNIPLGFFSKPAMKKRDEKLLEFCGFAPDVSKFDKSAESIKKDAFDQSKKNQEMIKYVAHGLAEEGSLSLALDYKSILNQKGDEEPDALGMSLILNLEERFHYPLDYKPSKFKDKEATVAMAKDILKDYGLWQLVQDGKVSFVCDAGLVQAVKKLAPNCFIEVCHFHTVGRIQDNTLGKNLENYDKRANAKKKEMNKFITFCKDGFSKEARKSLPERTAKSINHWTFDHQLTEEDRLNMGRYLNPKGWKKIWNDEELTGEEVGRRAAFISKFKKLPVVKRPKTIRPRTLKPALDALMILKPHLLAAREDESHPLNEHVQENSIDFDFVQAQHSVAELLEPFIDFFERDDNHQIGEYFAVVTHLCKWAGMPQINNSKFHRELQNHKDRFKNNKLHDNRENFIGYLFKNLQKRALLATITEQMFQVYVTDKDCKCPPSLKEADCECFTVTNKKVPLRLSPAQKIFSRLWFMNNNAQSKNLDTNMRLREARLYLKQSTDIVVLRYAKLWFKKSLNFAKEADEEIIKLANRLQLDVVLPATTLTQEANRLMIDDDDEAVEGPAFNFSSPQARNEPYSVDENSAQKQLLNYNSQSDADFQDRFL